MKSISEYIAEATDDKRWVAIEVTTAADRYHSKETTSQRVVTYDTYREMKEKGYTRGSMEISHIEVISPVCKSKEAALQYVDAPKKERRKSEIDKKGADYIVYCISSGKMSPSGKSNWDWNMWEEWKDLEIYIGQYGRSFLVGTKGSLKVGDTVCCVDNDSQKTLSLAPKAVVGVCDCNIDAFRAEFRRLFPDMCKRPSFSFGRKVDGLPWQRMGQFYSIKGISE